MDGLEKAAADFVSNFELVFDNDWSHTKESSGRERYLKATGTFLAPDVEDESDDWSNRGNLLDAYRTLKTVLQTQGIHE